MGESAVGWANCRVGARASRRGVEGLIEGRARWLEVDHPLFESAVSLSQISSEPASPRGRVRRNIACRRRPACLACLGAPRS